MLNAGDSRSGPDARVDVAVAASALILGLFSVVTLIDFGYLNYTRLPWFDGWNQWDHRLNATGWLNYLFAPHNEHRIPVSRILYLADEYLVGADARLLLWTAYLAQFGTAFLLYRLACSSAVLSRIRRAYLLGLTLAFTFSAAQWIDFSWTFQVCFVVVFFAAIGAFAALKNSRGPGGATSVPWVAASMATALLASGTMANGLLVWPLLVVMALWLRLERRAVWALAVVGTLVFWAYQQGYPPRAGTSVSEALMRTPELLAFAFAYLGSAADESFVAITRAVGLDWDAYRVPLCAVLGCIGLGWFFRLLSVATREDNEHQPARLAMLHILAFLIGSALLTAAGRLHVPIKEALTSRYVTPSLLFWVTTISLSLTTSVPEPESGAGITDNTDTWGRRFRLVALVAAALIGGLIQLPKMAYAVESEAYINEAEYALINNVFIAEAWGRFTTPPGKMMPVVRYFREHHLASFSQEWTRWIGEPVRAHFVVDTTEGACGGAWESVLQTGGSFTPAAAGVGWGYDRRFRRAPKRIVFADQAGLILGYAATSHQRPDVTAQFPEFQTARIGWLAYLPAGIATDATAFVLLGDGRSVCRIGNAHIPGNYYTAPAARAGAPVVGVAVSAHGTWARNMPPPGSPAPPFATDTWSSQMLGTGNGSLRIGPVTLVAGSAIGLPLTTGRGASSTRVSVIERATGDVLATASPPANSSTWDLWKLDMPAAAPGMIVDYVVEHSGRDAGDWVMVGTPRSIAP